MTSDRHSSSAAGQTNAIKRDLTSWWRRFNMRMRKEEEKDAAAAVAAAAAAAAAAASANTEGHGENEDDLEPPRIFGVPLQESIKYANVAISLTDGEGRSFIYGYVPIVVAKCGVFLKEKATEVEGIFRLSGSSKRIKELQTIFNSPDRYGKGLDWTGFTVHDAANILRRYLNLLPEPIIPLEFYNRFRDPLKRREKEALTDFGAIDRPRSCSLEEEQRIIEIYRQVITELPPLNRQLLLYILDLLAVFASKSDLNRMTAANLAAIFQPGILSHPDHAMEPDEYRHSQDVLVFLIEKQDHFLMGMRGTASSEETLLDVQTALTVMAPPEFLTSAAAPSPAPAPATPPPAQSNRRSAICRSPSDASGVGVHTPENVRRVSGLRRNVSTSSKQSNAAASPGSPAFGWATPGSGVHRSNTVPSKKSPGLSGPRFPHGTETPTTPPVSTPSQPEPSIMAVPPLPEPLVREPVQPYARAAVATDAAAAAAAAAAAVAAEYDTAEEKLCLAAAYNVPAVETTTASPTAEFMVANPGPPALEPSVLAPAGFGDHPVDLSLANPAPAPDQSVRSVSPAATPVKERSLSSLFSRSPTSDNERREGGKVPNKLRKKRIPGATSESAQSSTQSLLVENGK